MPISRKRLIKAMALSSTPVISNARMAPTPAEGSVERIVIGWMKLS
jgi:hypothetical protein